VPNNKVSSFVVVVVAAVAVVVVVDKYNLDRSAGVVETKLDDVFFVSEAEKEVNPETHVKVFTARKLVAILNLILCIFNLEGSKLFIK
jgi:hypothetical protein